MRNAIRCWTISEWPKVDRIAWELGCTPGDPFDDPHYGANLRYESLVKIARGYGRWLCFIDSVFSPVGHLVVPARRGQLERCPKLME